MLTIKKRVMEYFNGLTVVSMMANGVMVSKMVKAFIQLQMEKLRRVYGNKEKESSGFDIY
jgi:hypothetical protein